MTQAKPVTTEDKTEALLRAAYDPARFRRDGHALVDRLADYFADAYAGKGPVLAWRDPAEELALAVTTYGPAASESLGEITERTLATANHLHHPHYVGHQVSAPMPTTALTEMISATLNNGMAVYEMGPLVTALECRLMKFFGEALGLGPAADGLLTSGGSLGNLTALLAARNHAEHTHKVPASKLCFITSSASHYSVTRAAAILGLGGDACMAVAVDANHRLGGAGVAEAIAKAKASGRVVAAVIASACSTTTGTYDALGDIGKVCKREGVWFHVDGAHGASVIWSERYRHLLRGIEHADSVVWDMHKMMMMPALITAVIFRNGAHSRSAFAEEISYLYGRPDDEWWNMGHRTFECTKRMMSLTVHTALATHGVDTFAAFIDRTHDLTGRFADMLTAAPDFHLALRPESNIVCFRYTGPGTADGDPAFQPRIRQKLIRDGHFYLVQAKLGDVWHLRTTLMNPFTTETDLAELMDAIRAAAGDA